MEVKNLINQVFQGDEFFHTWDYDNTYSSADRDLLGLPYSLVCAELNENTVVAHVVDPESPVDFMEENGRQRFTLDSSEHPRFYKSSMSGKERKVFYTKLVNENNIRQETRLAQFTLNIFKNGNSIFGAPENSFLAPIYVNLAFEELERSLKDLKTMKEDSIFEEREVGSFFFQVDFLKEEPYRLIKWKSKGISYDDIVNIVNHIYGNIPAHMK